MDDTIRNLQQLYEATPVLVAAYDGFDRLRYANAAFRAAFFVDEEERPVWADFMRRNFHLRRGTVITVPDIEAWLVSTLSRRGKVPFRSLETDLHDGRWLLMTETVTPDGWMLCIASDITALKAEERVVRQARDFAIRAAHTDDLTGVANRRYVTARVEELLDRARSNAAGGANGCVCVLDLDNFKYINDRYGHQAGDTILRDLAMRINGQLRRSDCFGRVGGEEFVLVLPDTLLHEAALIVERLLGLVRLARPLPERPDFAYTFSAGVAAARIGDTFAEIYGRADKALYAAKLAGRNRIELEEGPAPAAAAG